MFGSILMGIASIVDMGLGAYNAWATQSQLEAEYAQQKQADDQARNAELANINQAKLNDDSENGQSEQEVWGSGLRWKAINQDEINAINQYNLDENARAKAENEIAQALNINSKNPALDPNGNAIGAITKGDYHNLQSTPNQSLPRTGAQDPFTQGQVFDAASRIATIRGGFKQ